MSSHIYFLPDSSDNKSVIFTLPITVVSKNYWFLYNYDYEEPAILIIELSNSEKQIYGYDLILVTWCKMCLFNTSEEEFKQKIFKQLKDF